MIRLGQRDPQWSGLKLGASRLTIGAVGCTTTCIAMLSDYFGKYMTPKAIAAHQDWYTKPGDPQGEGLILWTKLAIPGMKFIFREYSQNDTRIKAALADPHQAVILRVDNGAHWVVALKYLGNGDYLCADPWFRKDCSIKSVFHNIDGAAYFGRA